MRNLTITRRKSLIGSANKDKVYIRDDQSWEITIEGVPCRKIGEIKNGETKIFSISEEEQQIYLIADKLSKERCNASLVIPAGQEDVSLSGVHHFVPGSNPFRFDGVELSAEQIAKQKKGGRKGFVILIVAMILGFTFGGFIGKGIGKLLTSGSDDPQTFVKEDFAITLTDAFQETQNTGFFVSYTSKSAAVFVVREDKTLFDNITLDEYCELVKANSNQKNMQKHSEEGLAWFDYTYTDDQQDIYYMACCYEGENAFWVVNFATPTVNRDQYTDAFLQWAKTLKVG